MKNKYGYETKEMHDLFRRILEGREDPRKEETLYGVMDQIQDFFDSCYWLGINPLREMRKMFPNYKWFYVQSEYKQYIQKWIARSHLVWRVNWFDDVGNGEWADEFKLVVAVKEDEAPPKPANQWFFADSKKKTERSTAKLDFIKEFGGVPVYAEIMNA